MENVNPTKWRKISSRGRGGFEHFTDGMPPVLHVTESVRLKERGEKSVEFLFGTECMVAIFDVSDLDVV